MSPGPVSSPVNADSDELTITVIRAILVIVGLGLLAACAPLPERTPGPPMQPDASDALPQGPFWRSLGKTTTPVREKIRDRYRYRRTQQFTEVADVWHFYYEPQGRKEPVGFTLVNRGSPRINPRGRATLGATRQYAFFFPDRAREDIYLEINDDVRLSKRFSYDNMFREMHFFPRRQLPSVSPIESGRLLKVTLPTGEPVIFDARSKEITAGVLDESPIDFNPRRHDRRNPSVRYRGRHLVVTVAQRGEAARRDRVWGRTKHAEVHYPAKYAKACRLSPRYIWEQTPKPGDVDPTLVMLHASDASLFALIERQCGWDLSGLDL